MAFDREQFERAKRAVEARGTTNPLPTQEQIRIVKAGKAFLARQRRKARGHSRRKKKALPQFVGTYRDYLDSPQWAAKKRQAFKHYGHKCAICGDTEGLHVHHISYKTLFREAMEHLQVLCAGCHQNAHESDKGAIDPITARFVAIDF